MRIYSRYLLLKKLKAMRAKAQKAKAAHRRAARYLRHLQGNKNFWSQFCEASGDVPKFDINEWVR